jgi:hypothetical protein
MFELSETTTILAYLALECAMYESSYYNNLN